MPCHQKDLEHLIVEWGDPKGRDNMYMFDRKVQPNWKLIFSLILLCFVQESLDALTTCVTKDIGFSEGKPVAAFTIYKFLLHWKSFEAERTSVFDRLVNMIGDVIKVTLYTISNYHVLLSFCPSSCVHVPACMCVSLLLFNIIPSHT